jgi:competence protein ComEA
MEAAPTSVRVVAAPAPPANWPASPWLAPPSDPPLQLASEATPVWSRSAQVSVAMLLLLAITLVSWHAWSVQRNSCRPSTLESDALNSLSLDLNQADHAQLLQLPGVGENLARRIETYRAEHHGFRNVDELRHVSGIGASLLEKLRPFLFVASDERDEEGEPALESPRPADLTIDGERQAHTSSSKKTLAARLDINHATVAELRGLPGIGVKLSERIVEARAKKSFRTVEDLRRVPGIGPRKLDALRPHVVVVPRGEKETTP